MKGTIHLKSIIAIFILVFILFNNDLSAQCKIKNDYFQAGEEMTYDLYAKFGPIHTKAGKSILSTTADKYNNTNVYKISLIAESTGNVQKLFTLNDTLISYMTKELVPLAYVKNAHEGKDNVHETVNYTYSAGGKIDINVKRHKNGEDKFDNNLTSNNCIYDMASVVMYARTLDYSKMKKGDDVDVEFMSGRKKVKMVIEHDGIENIKANNKVNYECIKLVLSISDDAFTNKQEAMRVYITNDKNRMPVRLDSQLKIGSTRAILKAYKGNKYPIGQN